MKYWLQGQVSELEESSEQAEAVAPLHQSDMAFIRQPYSPFFATTQNVEGVEQLSNRL